MLTILIVGLSVVVASIWILNKTKKQTTEAPKAAEVVAEVAETPVVKLKPVLKKKAQAEAPAKAPKAAKAKPAAKATKAAKPAATKRAGKKL